jgi:hypothetical protein
MIKWIIFCVVSVTLVLVGYRKWEKYRKHERKFIKEETVLSYLDRSTFFAKLKTELPLWMKEQINEDFEFFEKRGISSAQVDATFASIRNNFPHPFYVRYRVVNNQLYRYVPEGEKIPLINNAYEKALKTLIKLRRLEDTDFIIAFEDGVPLQGIPERFYFAPTTDLQAPLLISAKRKGTPYAVLVPDWRSIGEWWARDIKNVLSAQEQKLWAEKKEKAIWRGGLTREARLTFCEMALSVSTLIDAKINSCDPSRVTECQNRGVMGDRVSWEEYLEYKYQPILDGVMCAAPAFQWRLLSKCVTFKQESDEIQWFYRVLKPFIHYIPFKNDFSDVVQQIEWAKTHDSLCAEIALNAEDFARNNILLEDNCIYFLHVLKKYASLQKLDQSTMKRELNTDPRWVCIQDCRALRRLAQQHQMEGYTLNATPY